MHIHIKHFSPDLKWSLHTLTLSRLMDFMSARDMRESQISLLFCESWRVLSHWSLMTAGNLWKDFLSRPPRFPQPTIAQRWGIMQGGCLTSLLFATVATLSVKCACHPIWRGHPPSRDPWRHMKTHYSAWGHHGVLLICVTIGIK